MKFVSAQQINYSELELGLLDPILWGCDWMQGWWDIVRYLKTATAEESLQKKTGQLTQKDTRLATDDNDGYEWWSVKV